MYDVFIKNGMVIDGSGKKGVIANIGIKNEKIVYIGNELYEGTNIIDADGKVVTPGFIDPHSHGDFTINGEDIFAQFAKLSQGITTEIVGNCGSSVFPISKEHRQDYLDGYGFMLSSKDYAHLDKFESMKAFSAYISNKKLYVNSKFLIGHSILRLAVMGYENRLAEAEELERMKSILREGMENGAIGLSTGLIYPPGPFAGTEEIIELCKVVSEYDGIYATHIRNESDDVVSAVQEAIDIAEKANVKLWISHHKAMGVKNKGKVHETIALMEKYKKKGLEIYYDIYPYTASSTYAHSMLAPRYMEKGKIGLAEALKDKGFREEVKKDMQNPKEPYENFFLNCGSFDNILIATCTKTKEAEGRTITEYASEHNYLDPFDALFDLLIKNECNVICCYFCMSYDDIDFLIQKEYGTLGTDGIIITRDSYPHPRAFGTFPYGIHRFVNEKKYFTLEEFIHKITGFVAQQFKVEKRGVIKIDNYADIVVFDPDTINGTNSYIESSKPSDGIEYVLVNGKIVYKDKKLTGISNGKLLV